MSDYVISIRDVTKSFGTVKALNGFSHIGYIDSILSVSKTGSIVEELQTGG